MVVKERMDFNIKIEFMKWTWSRFVCRRWGRKWTYFLSIKSVKR